MTLRRISSGGGFCDDFSRDLSNCAFQPVFLITWNRLREITEIPTLFIPSRVEQLKDRAKGDVCLSVRQFPKCLGPIVCGRGLNSQGGDSV
ncbi:hypothetical protein Leryth_024481 [Lithospermum erythrorhizon]|nr:hypothetical protein Leryth_024481 [Lithospermum erythrorhizon]